jgi:hypothetical protein
LLIDELYRARYDETVEALTRIVKNRATLKKRRPKRSPSSRGTRRSKARVRRSANHLSTGTKKRRPLAREFLTPSAKCRPARITRTGTFFPQIANF